MRKGEDNNIFLNKCSDRSMEVYINFFLFEIMTNRLADGPTNQQADIRH